MARNSVDTYAIRVIRKWLKKGNMARAMRDVLPSSGLGMDERNQVAEIVHHIVRFKNLYDYALDKEGLEKSAENYVKLYRKVELLVRYAERARRENLHHVYLSASKQVSRILLMYPKFAEIINKEPDTHLSVNLPRMSRDEVLLELRNSGYRATKCAPETCICGDGGLRYSPPVKEGLAIVQDSSSQHVSKIVSSLGDKILDYCAGSGGKTFTIKFLNPDAKVHVHDVNERKIESLFYRASKLGVDVERMKDGEYEVVLVDAPCSGLGSASRNPEAKYREDLDTFPSVQMDILREARDRVSSGGFLVYVVCTFNPDETYLLVERFLRENGDFEEFIMGGGKHMVKEKTGSYIISGDVMYIAVMRKVRG